MNGRDIEVGRRDWFGSWALASASSCLNPDQKVVAYIDEHGGWKETEIRRDFLPFEAEEILNTLIIGEGMKDSKFWKF